LLEPHTVWLETIPADASLEREGVEVLSCLEELHAAGVTADSCDLGQKNIRAKVGEATIQALMKRFGPTKIVLHAADTSRVSGGTSYGEATIRDTTPGKTVRTAQSAAHIDHFLPGVAQCLGKNATSENGAEALIDTYWHLWRNDVEPRGLGKAAVKECLMRKMMLNAWVALTPGGVQQDPLAVVDPRSVNLEKEQAFQSVNTVPIQFSKVMSTVTVLRSSTAQSNRWLWKPEMQFGDMLLFHTTQTPHAAVRLCEAPYVPRQSSEMRVFILDNGSLPGQ